MAAIEPDAERPPGAAPARPGSVIVPGLVEALSERELEVSGSSWPREVERPDR